MSQLNQSHARVVFVFAAMTMLSAFGLCPSNLISQTEMAKSTPTANSEKAATALDSEMMTHQAEMNDLLGKLQKSFEALAAVTDTRGHTSDKALLKAHEADITALRNAVREHKLFLIADIHHCGSGGKQADLMMVHQQQMKAVLYDVVDTFFTYETANDTSIDSSEPAEDALTPHRAALKELGDASVQHDEAMKQMMKRCA